MEKEKYNDNVLGWSVFILSSLVFLLFVIGFFYNKPDNDSFEEERINENKYLIEDMISQGILKLSFYLDSSIKFRAYKRKLCWYKVDSIKINNEIISIDSLYRKEDFIFKNCDNHYYFIMNDTYSFQAYYEIIFSLDNCKYLNEHGDRVSRKKINIDRKRYLPKCFDE